MKKNILTRLVALLMMALVPLLSLAVNSIIYNATYDFDNLTLGTDTLGGVTYTTVNYDGLFNGGEPGKPSLPVDYIKFSVPYNATNFTVTATLQNNMISNLSSYLVYPCQLARLMNDTTPIVITPPDNNVYNSNSYYPSQNAWVVDEGFLAGENHIVTVAVMPMSYKHRVMGGITTHQLKKSGTVRLVLSYDLSDTPAMYPIIREDATLRQEGYALTRSMVANPDNVISFAPTEINIGPNNPNTSGGLNSGGNNPSDSNNVSHEDPFDPNPTIMPPVPYLIVTTPDLLHSMRRIAALERQKGYRVKVVTMDEVMNAPYIFIEDSINTDNADVLRQYLRYHYQYYGTKYVLLSGDIPSKIYIKDENKPNERDFLTDWYYCDLNSNWTDFVHDMEPELFVGRIVAKTEEQIDNYTNKLLMYEMNPGNGDYSYLRRAFYSNGRVFTGFLDEVIDTLNPIFPEHIIINDSIGHNDLYPKGHDIIDSIRTHRVGFMCIFNHGDSVRVTVYGKDSNNKRYFIREHSTESSGNGLNCLHNKYYPIIYYSPSCKTVPFDDIITTNFGESFTTGKDYGGPVYIGHTRDVYSLESKSMTMRFARQLVHNCFILGEAYALSTSQYAPYGREEIYTNCYLGDPLTELWTDEPQSYSDINSDIIISRIDNSITLTGIEPDSTIVAYCNNDYNAGLQITSNSSLTLHNISPNSIITLYRHNYIPYILPIELQNIMISNSQYVYANDFTAGSNINQNRVSGDVMIKNGAEYEIEACGVVTLNDGFTVEKGAIFMVHQSSIR